MVKRGPDDSSRHTIAPFSPQMKLKQPTPYDIMEALSGSEGDDDVALAYHFEVRGSYNIVVGKMLCDERA
jgi:hypothetical protein